MKCGEAEGCVVFALPFVGQTVCDEVSAIVMRVTDTVVDFTPLPESLGVVCCEYAGVVSIAETEIVKSSTKLDTLG